MDTVGPDVVERQHRLALEMMRAAAGRPGLPGSPTESPVEPDSAQYPPEIPAAALTPLAIGGGVRSSGCLLVRGLLDAAVAVSLATDIDRTFDAFDDWLRAPDQPATGPWFSAFRPEELAVHMTRPALRAGGGVFTADSPQLFARWIQLIRTTGLHDTVSSYFGEPPVTSLTKGTLRRVHAGEGIEWHQDGAFLGIDSGALNVWVSLSDTTDSPGLDIVGRRFDTIVPTGSHGAGFDWSVGSGLIDELTSETGVERPHFAAGDALIFDGMLLHRTAQPPPSLPSTRYAIETWFFPPSRFPDHQRLPLAF